MVKQPRVWYWLVKKYDDDYSYVYFTSRTEDIRNDTLGECEWVEFLLQKLPMQSSNGGVITKLSTMERDLHNLE